MRGKTGKRRILAWIAAWAMLCSLIMVPAGKAEAADQQTVNGADNASLPVHVEIRTSVCSGADWSDAADYTQYEFTIVNGSSTTISDWTLTVQKNNGTFTKYNAGWNGAPSSGVVGSNKIVIGTYQGSNDSGETWSNATIEAGKSAGGPGMQVATADMDDVTYILTYQTGESTTGPSVDDTQTDPSKIGSTDSNVKAVITQEQSSGAYHSYFLQINNGSTKNISDWIVVVPVSGITSSERWDDSWNKVNATFTSEYLYLTPKTGSEGVIPAGGTYGSASADAWKFNYKGSSDLDTSKAVVYFKEGSSYTGAFDGVVKNATQGTGGSSGGSGGGSNGSPAQQTNKVTKLDNGSEYNYAKLLQYSLYFFDANMCGPDVEKYCSLNWRKACHTSDQSVTYKGRTVDVSGGFHDAGDFEKFGLPQGYAASLLGIGYYEYKDAYTKTGQTEHFKKIMDYFCDYFRRATVLDDSGNAIAFCYQLGAGESHNVWKSPEEDTASRTAYFADSSNPATDQVSEAAAALAIHYMNFGDEQNLTYAKKLFAMATKNNKSIKTSDGGTYYVSSSWEDDYCLAAAWLYKATNDAQYKNAYEQYKSNINGGGWPSWDQVGAYAQAYGEENWDALGGNAATMINSCNYTPDGYAVLSEWGSARYNANIQLEGMIYDKHSNKDYYTSWSQGQMWYLMGSNSKAQNFIVGVNSHSPKHPHHRGASGYANWPNQGYQYADQKYSLIGALVGGIKDASGTYDDNSDDAVCNEVAIDYNAAYTGAVAALYLKNADDGNQKIVKASDTDKPSVIKTFYDAGGSSTGGDSSEASSASSTATTKSSSEASTGSGGSGGGSETPTEIRVTAIRVEPTSVTLTKGESKTLSATITPANATRKEVVWSSKDDTIAKVDENGTVTAVGRGQTQILATAQGDSGKVAACTVTVNEKQEAPVVTGYTVDKTKTTTTGFSIKAAVQGEQTNLQYRLKGQTDWQDDGNFTGLKPFTKYTVEVRYKGDGQYLGDSDVAAETKDVYTAMESGTTIDLSRLGDPDYVDALVATGDVNYGNQYLALTKKSGDGKDKTYTLTGSAPDVTVGTYQTDAQTNFTLKLENVTIKKLDPGTLGKLQIEASGTNRITEVASLRSVADVTLSGNGTLEFTNGIQDSNKLEITGGCNVTAKTIQAVESVTITGSGQIKADAIASSGIVEIAGTGKVESIRINANTAIRIKSGTVIAEGENSMIGSANVTISGGSVTISGAGSSSKISGNQVTISGGTVTAEGTGEVVSAAEVTVSDGTVTITNNGNGKAINGNIIKISGGKVTAKAGEGADAIAAGKSVSITGGNVEADGGAGGAAISGDKVEIKDATIEANGGNAAAIKAKDEIVIDNADVKVGSGNGSTAPAIDADKITVDDSKIRSTDEKNDNIYSTPPKKSDGSDAVNYVTVTYLKQDGTSFKTAEKVEENAVIRLPDIPAQRGYTFCWMEMESKVVYQAGASITVRADMTFKVQSTAIATAGIQVDQHEIRMQKGAVQVLHAAVTPADALDTGVRWTSDDSQIATVDGNGTVTAVGAGTTVIRATTADGTGISDSCKITVYQTGLVQEGDGTRYYDDNGNAVVNRQITIGANRYYFDGNGRMVKNKLQKIGNTYYYFAGNGVMVKNKLQKVGRYYYFFGSNGGMVRNKLQRIGRYYYYFANNGVMVQNRLQRIGRYYYYFAKNGVMMQNRLVRIGRYYYYFANNGVMMQNRLVRIGRYYYYFHRNGVMATGWVRIGRNYFYFNQRGIFVAKK